MLLGLFNGKFAKVKNTGGKHRVSAAIDNTVRQVLQRTDATRRDYRHVDCLGNLPYQRQIETIPHAIAIHTGYEQFAGPRLRHLLGPVYGVNAGRGTSTMGEYFPFLSGTIFDTLGVNGDDDTLVAKMVAGLADKCRVFHRRSVDGDFIRADLKQAVDILQFPNTATDSKGNKYFASHFFDHIENRISLISAGGDIQEGNFICPLAVVAARDFNGVASISYIYELYTFHYPTGVNVQAGNNALRRVPFTLSSMRQPMNRYSPNTF